jgi:lipoic acid synthetase
LAVEKFYTLEEFDQLKNMALASGFKAVESGPFVRSSYHAGLMYDTIRCIDNESKMRNIG